MSPTIEIVVNKERLACIINLLEQAHQVGSPEFKICIGQDGSFLVTPLVKFELKAWK